MVLKELSNILRHIMRYRVYSLINLLGLSLGISCALLIILWINNEINIDKFHKNADNLYQVMKQMKFSDGETTIDVSITGPLAPVMAAEIPEVEAAVRVTWKQDLLFRIDERAFFEEGFFADSNFFQVFSFELIYGDPATVLKDPNSVVISQKLAKKLFKEKDPLGQILEIQIEDIEPYTVTGIFRDVSSNSSVEFDFVMPFNKYYKIYEQYINWDNWSMMTFILVKSGTTADILNKKINAVHEKHGRWHVPKMFVHPFKKMYLYNDFGDSMNNPSGRILLVRVFSAVSIFILFLACMNYTNLSTALAIKRAKEVGVKKMAGSSRYNLVRLFILESLVLTIIALFVALIVVEFSLPFFNSLIKKEIQLDYLDLKMIGIFILVAIFTGLFAGTFPAIFLSSFKPVTVLKNIYKGSNGGIQLRHILIVVQFVITITFIISSLVIYRQIKYIQNKSLGLDKDNIILFEQNDQIMKHKDVFKEMLLKEPGVLSVSYVSDHPLSISNSTAGVYWRGKDEENDYLISYINVDEDFAETFNIEIIEGRDFSKDYPADTNCVILNEEVKKIMGFDNPIGEIYNYWGRRTSIIGIVKNFHFNSLHNQIDNLMLICRPRDTDGVAVKIKGNMIKKSIRNVEKVFREFENNIPFIYHFVDEQYQEYYEREQYMAKFSNLFAALAIVISCLGLFGLALFTTEQRTKEIGIRKSMGATASQVMLLLTRDFIKWIALSYIIACIIAWYAMNSWLDNFAYRTDIKIWDFIITGFISLAIALLTVSWQSYRGASKNPVESLRYE
jgi:putative ABC transport system permease protein